jgi:hypothetical protein
MGIYGMLNFLQIMASVIEIENIGQDLVSKGT